MAGSTGTAERWERDTSSSPIPAPPSAEHHPESGINAGAGCAMPAAPQDESDPQRASGTQGCRRTSNPFGPRAMTLLLSVHLHLGKEHRWSVSFLHTHQHLGVSVLLRSTRGAEGPTRQSKSNVLFKMITQTLTLWGALNQEGPLSWERLG